MRVCRASTGGRSGGQGPTRAGMFFVGPRKHLSSPDDVAPDAGTSSSFCDIVTSVLVTNWRRPGTNLDGHQLPAQLGVSACRWAIREQQKAPPGRLGLSSSREIMEVVGENARGFVPSGNPRTHY
jgi:hypothetical protein